MVDTDFLQLWTNSPSIIISSSPKSEQSISKPIYRQVNLKSFNPFDPVGFLLGKMEKLCRQAVISGLVATLKIEAGEKESTGVKETLARLASHPAIEVGDLCNENRLPLTIEAEDGWPTEDLTRWISDQPGVEFVDVVCVHYENS